MKLFSLILFVTIQASAFAAQPVSKASVKTEIKAPSAQAFSESEGTVDFFATGKPSMLKVHGTDSAVSGTLEKKNGQLSGTFTVPMKEFTTGGMKLRDTHMKEKVFEVEKYPTAELKLEPLKIAGESEVPFSGKLKFHGVEKTISGMAKVKENGDSIVHEANFSMLLTDYGITPPEFSGMKIQNEVRVEVKGKASAKK